MISIKPRKFKILILALAKLEITVNTDQIIKIIKKLDKDQIVQNFRKIFQKYRVAMTTKAKKEKLLVIFSNIKMLIEIHFNII